MQQLTAHFNRKKTQFNCFFSSILQVIQKLAYQIQIEIDKEYHQSAIQFKNYDPNSIIIECLKMEQNRVQVYHEMIDRLYVTLKNFAHQIASQKRPQLSQPIQYSQSFPKNHQNQPRKTIPNVVTSQQTNSQKPGKTVQANESSQMIRLGQLKENIHESEARNTYNYRNIQQNSNQAQIPSPFVQKLRHNQEKLSNSQRPESSSQRSRQKIEIMKKTDVCQSLDNYLNKQAKQMLQRSISRQSSYSSMRKSLTKKYDTPQRPKYDKHYESSHIDRRIEAKLGSYGDTKKLSSYGESNSKYQIISSNNDQHSSKKHVENMISPIQRYEFN